MSNAFFFIRAALQQLDDNQITQALNTTKLGLLQHPDHGELWELSGMARWSIRETDLAVADLETATALKPLSILGQITLGEAYLAQGKKDLARSIFLFLAEPGRCPIPLLHRVASGLGSLEENEIALQVCEFLVYQRPTHHAAWFGIAFYRLRLGASLSDVLSVLEVPFNLAPNVLSYRLNLAQAYFHMGLVAEAYALVREVDPETVSCPCMTKTLATIADVAGDRKLAKVFQKQCRILRRNEPHKYRSEKQ